MKLRLLGLLSALVLGLALTACGGNTTDPTAAPTETTAEATAEVTTEASSEAPTVETTTEAPTEETTETPTEAPSWPSEEISSEESGGKVITVEAALYEIKTFESSTFSYVIPRICFDGVTDNGINEQIRDDLYTNLYKPVIEDRENRENQEPIPWLKGLSFDWSLANGILSVVCIEDIRYPPETVYHVYNILVREERLATQEEVLAAFGMDQSEFRALCVELLGSRFWSRYFDYREEYGDNADMMAQHDMLLRMTLEDENIAECVPFVGPNDDLFVLGKLSTIAGAGYAYTLVPADMMIDTEFYSRLTDN